MPPKRKSAGAHQEERENPKARKAQNDDGQASEMMRPPAEGDGLHGGEGEHNGAVNFQGEHGGMDDTQLWQSLLGNGQHEPSRAELSKLEGQQRLERVMWPKLDCTTAKAETLLLLAAIVGEKGRQGASLWDWYMENPHTPFEDVLESVVFREDDWQRTEWEKSVVARFLGLAFGSLEHWFVRKACLPLVSLPLWFSISEGRRELELSKHPDLRKRFQKLARKEGKKDKPVWVRREATLMIRVVDDFSISLRRAAGDRDQGAVAHCERALELFIDLLAQLPTRRFTKAFFEDKALLARCRQADLPSGSVLTQQVDLLKFYLGFEVDEHSGAELTEDDALSARHEELSRAQRLMFNHVPELRELSLLAHRQMERRKTIWEHLGKLDPEKLRTLVCDYLKLGPRDCSGNLLLECVATAWESRPRQADAVRSLPLYPTEEALTDAGSVPAPDYDGSRCLALPKLNLQFLTIRDYLLRLFHLLRLEAAHDAREHFKECVQALTPKLDALGESVHFAGTAREALPLQEVTVTEVGKPMVGESRPSRAKADVSLSLNGLHPSVRGAWDGVSQHDAIFLVKVAPKSPSMVAKVRGGEVIEVKDRKGNALREGVAPDGEDRVLEVRLDASQYQTDVDELGADGAESLYAEMNVAVKRKAKESNAASFLDMLRAAMEEGDPCPSWLRDLLLGYGDPEEASWCGSVVDHERLSHVDLLDTFLGPEHANEVLSSLGWGVHVAEEYKEGEEGSEKEENIGMQKESHIMNANTEQMQAETMIRSGRELGKDVEEEEEEDDDDDEEEHERGKGVDDTGSFGYNCTIEFQDAEKQAVVRPYKAQEERLGALGLCQGRNKVRFTGKQAEAIMGAQQPGICQVVGPPGTGKTDVAAQAIAAQLKNWPGRRVLLVTHSNAALNDLFAKLPLAGVDSTRMVRLGHGERGVVTEEDLDFSPEGRVDALLSRRLELLAKAERVAHALGIPHDMAATCERAMAMYTSHVRPAMWSGKHAPKVFGKGGWRAARRLFAELEELWPLEVLGSGRERSKFVLAKRARVVAMTCAHAAIKRQEYAEAGLAFDSLVMEEAAKASEAEAAAPFFLKGNASRLKRCLLIGDDHQLPPVVTNPAFQRYSRLDQSLFARLRRLGTPAIVLNSQGRCRPSLAHLFDFVYGGLENLPRVTQLPEFSLANAGLAYTAQFIDVQDFHGRGEEEPEPHAFINRGEAEYICSLYQYMRLLGHPAESIAVLSMYRGQKRLLRHIFWHRCAQSALFGMPGRITTVDKFQGQQTDHVLLSLVRTRTPGHVRDPRRMVVAFSRARLGLYIFGRWSLFNRLPEISRFLQPLRPRPQKLSLVSGESHPCPRSEDDPVAEPYHVPDAFAMGEIVNEASRRAQGQVQESQAS